VGLQFNALIVVLFSKGNLITKGRCRIRNARQQYNRLATPTVASRLSVTKKSDVAQTDYNSHDLLIALMGFSSRQSLHGTERGSSFGTMRRKLQRIAITSGMRSG